VRVVFMGSPAFALPSLQRLSASEHDVVAVVTQPDRPAGRGRGVQSPPVKTLALEHGIPVLQPKSVNTPDVLDAIHGFSPDALVVAAFGQILKQALLDIPQRGSVNVHASLLPKFRGAAPVVGALLAGEHTTGVTIMEVELALDAGPIVAQRECEIEAEDTAGTLTAKLAELGADLLVEVLPAWERGELDVTPQNDALATYVKPVRTEDAVIDWSMSAEDIWRRVRAFNPWPVAATRVDGATLRILRARPLSGDAGVPPGTVVGLPHAAGVTDAGFAVQCGSGLLAVIEAQRSGKRAMTGAELLRGWRDLMGRRLGT
jgi:methionyl-tRNA formyltransferase